MTDLRARGLRPVRVARSHRHPSRGPDRGHELRIFISAVLFGAAGGPIRADVFAAFSGGQSSYCVHAVCGGVLPDCGSEPGVEVGVVCNAQCGSWAEANGRCSFLPGSVGINEVTWSAYTRAECDQNCTAIGRFVTNTVDITVTDRPVAFQLALDQRGFSTLSFTWPFGGYAEANGIIQVNTTPREGVLLPGTYSVRVSGQTACLGPPGGAGTIDVHLKFGAIFWNNPGGGVYRLAQNWSPEQIPIHNQQQSDTAIIGLPGGLTIDFTGATAGRLLVRHASHVEIWGGGEVFGPDAGSPSLGIGEGGQLDIIGGTFRSVHACIGDEPDTDAASGEGEAAQVLVSNPGSCWDAAGSIEIGRAVEGRLLVSEGCVNSRDIRVGSGAPGELRVNRATSRAEGGRLSCDNLIVGAGLDVPGRGTVQIEDGGRVDCLLTRVGETGRILGNGVLTALESVENRGLIAPGLSLGTLTIEGDYVQQPTGILELEISGPDPNQFDVLHVTGDATLGGTLKLIFVGGYVPVSGAAFACLEVDGEISGQFAAMQVEGLPRGYRIAFDPQTGAATVRSRFELAEVVIRGVRVVPVLVAPR